MDVKELNRRQEQNGQTIATYEAGKLQVKLVSTYDNNKSFEDHIYAIACRRLADQMSRRIIKSPTNNITIGMS